MLRKLKLVAIFGLFFHMGIIGAKNSDLGVWRADREARLKAPDGWLSVVGLSWLKPGKNSVGSAFGQDVKLPKSAAKDLGEINLEDERVQIRFRHTDEVFIEGQPVEKGRPYDLVDKSGKALKVTHGSVVFFPIQRKNGWGIRVRDSQAEAIKKFKGCLWYPEDEAYRVQAKWVPLDSPKTLYIPDVIGNVNEEEAPGYAEFQLEGKPHRLYPTQSGDDLFFVFRDKTSGVKTYGSARFLYAKVPKVGEPLTLDFNKAYNPPCAFTDYATCPTAPKENILGVSIQAGEKYSK